MAERIFTKSILPSKLYEELKLVIPVIFDGVQYKNPVVTVVLTQEPNSTEDQLITDIVNNHVPSRKNYKIWSLVQDPKSPYIAPLDVDFNLLPLAIHRTYIKGEESVITYYRDATINPNGSLTFNDPILKATWSWTKDLIGFPIFAEERVEWFYEDDTIGPAQKLVPHYFDGLHKIRKGKEVRGTQIDDLQIPVSEMIVYNETVRRITEEANPSYKLTLSELDAALQIGRNFLTTYQGDFQAYIQHRDLKLVTTITNASESFLNWVNPYNPPNTIKDFILSELS